MVALTHGYRMVCSRCLWLYHSALNHGRARAATTLEKEVAGGAEVASRPRHDDQHRHGGEHVLFHAIVLVDKKSRRLVGLPARRRDASEGAG